MSYDSLSDFVSELEDDGDLVRVSAEVDPVFEIAEITRRRCASGGESPALCFDNVKGCPIPLVTNLLGSQRRMCRALRTASFDEVAARIVGLMEPELPQGWIESLKLVPHVSELTKLPPKSVKSGICQQVVKMGRDVDLAELPILTCWPNEAAPTITMGQVFTEHPKSHLRHVGLSPLEVRGQNRLAVHWNVHQESWRHFTEHRALGRQMPVAVVLGGDPVYTYMATAPLPPHTDACLLGGLLRGENVNLVKCRSIDLEVPADAEIVIEGLIDTAAELEPAGPIAWPTGFYGEREELPTLQVTALTHRSNPFYPAMIPGPPPMDEYWLGKATERVMVPFLKLLLPEIVDLHMPRAGLFRNLLFVSIRKQYPQQARQVMNGLWGLGQLAVAKMVVVVDENVDVHDEEQVWYDVGANTHPGRDVVFCEGPTHMTDHAAPVRGMGHKMGIDATRKSFEEGHPRNWPERLAVNEEIAEMVTRRWSEYGFD